MQNARSFQELFNIGAARLATLGKVYDVPHQAAGFTIEEWDLLTDDSYWTQEQQRQVGGVLGNAVSISLRLAGLAPTPLAGPYVAAVICSLVALPNRLVAALSAPATFNAVSALGVNTESEILPTTPEQMQALVMLFSGAGLQSIENLPTPLPEG